MPTLRHPDLPGVRIDVDESKARNRRQIGWVDVVDRPTVNAPKSDWVAYVTSLGLPADGATKQQLIDTADGADVEDGPPNGDVTL